MYQSTNCQKCQLILVFVCCRYAAIYLCAGMETLLEEIALIAGGNTAGAPITPAAIDLAVANCADLWGLLQPYSHLNAGRVASGKRKYEKAPFPILFNRVSFFGKKFGKRLNILSACKYPSDLSLSLLTHPTR